MKQSLSTGDRARRTRGTRKPNRSAKTGPPRKPARRGHRTSVTIPDRAVLTGAPAPAGSPAALLAVVPCLLGFMPESSIVVIGVEPPASTVKITLRYDLPDPADTDLAADIAAHAFSVITTQRLTAAIAVGYGPAALVDPMAAAFGEGAVEGDVDLMEFFRVDDSRYWSYTCSDQACCSEAGTPFDAAGASAVMADEETTVLADRAALAASIAPLAGSAAESMRQATRRAEQHVSQVLAKVRRSARLGAARQMIATEGLAAVAEMIAIYRRGGRYLTDYQLAWLTVALKDMRVRDDAWARMDPRHRDAHRRMWTDVVRRAQPGHVAAPASLLAFVAWQAGNGALANVALDRALADQPGYSMAELLRQVISAGAPPSMARLPMTPAEVAACYDDLDDLDDPDDLDEGDEEEWEQWREWEEEDEEYELQDGPCPICDIGPGHSPDDQALLARINCAKHREGGPHVAQSASSAPGAPGADRARSP